MAKKPLKVKLIGAEIDQELVQFSDFNLFCAALWKCLGYIDHYVAPTEKRLNYRIVGLEIASAEILLEAVPPKKSSNYAQESRKLFIETLRTLETGKNPPTTLDYEGLKTFRHLGDVLTRHSREIMIDGFRITTKYNANIDQLLNSSIASCGSVSGQLEAVNVHEQRVFTLYPRIGAKRISCQFPEAMLDDVKLGLKRFVTVEGILHFYGKSQFPHQVQVQAMKIHQPIGELTSSQDLLGIAPNITGSKNTLDFIRGLRDE